MDELQKTKSRLKMMEISFEQINNSRNDLIKQLGEQELINEKNQKLRELIEKILPTIISKAEALDDFESGNFIKQELEKLLEKSKK